MDAMVLATQKWLNNHYKGVSDFDAFSEKELDGITGSGTFKRLIEALQIELNLQYAAGLTVDGDFGNGTYNALPSVISASDTFDNSKANNIGSIAFVNAMNALTIVPKSIWYVNLAIVAVAVGVLTKQGDKHWGLLGITQFLTMVDDTDDMK